MSNTYNSKNDLGMTDKTMEALKKGGKITLLVIILSILVFDSFYSNKEQEQAVITTFGKASTVSESGLHFKLPIIQKVTKVDTTIKGFPIGYELESNESVDDESVMITSDFNFVNVDFFVEYKVSDPIRALYATEEPELVLKNIAQSCIRNVISSYDVDTVLTTGKNEIQSKIKENIYNKLEIDDIGIQLVNITIQDANPPTNEVMEAFKAVETAKQGKETALNNANKYRNEKMPATAAQVDKITQDAEATKQSRINEANAQVARFNEMYTEYAKNPKVTKTRMFYEAMENILPDLEVIIDSGNGSVQKVLPLDQFANINMNSENKEGSAETKESSDTKDKQ